MARRSGRPYAARVHGESDEQTVRLDDCSPPSLPPIVGAQPPEIPGVEAPVPIHVPVPGHIPSIRTHPVEISRKYLVDMGTTRDEQRRSHADFDRPVTAVAFSARTVVLVEGLSDQLALEALAERRGRNLESESIAIVPMAGSKNIGRFLDLFGPRGLGVRLAGLCDAAEEGDFQRGLERAGLGSNLTRIEMEQLGFYVCVEDLEDELIRSLGAAAVEEVIDAQGELASFRTFQKQPQWRARTNEEQLRRFFGTHRGRKIQSAPLLVAALDLTNVPMPLDRVLAPP